ncbi:hypothetical protein [Proteiniborus sp. MB09-C3]|uniref:hypothetical protein n=1 Tax=Proteiniborus sp. MB09-C3 TaxID=3050072 RepID=UPI00255597E3|nr:hypothetical protein [Proteiniborus sp. MB09-C3]WIV11593.1 hypothetical protein QO263_16045 [Proteiniborus sp. MB09-C3]
MRILENFLTIIFFIPFYALLIYSIMYPEQAAKMGKRWMYKGDIEPSEDYIKYIRFSSIVGVIVITFILVVFFTKS